MTRLRVAKVAGIAADIARSRWTTPTGTPKSSCSAGARPTGRSRRRSAGYGRRAIRWPTPTCATSTRSRPTWARSLRRYPKVLVPEMNLGQLIKLVRAEFLVDAKGLNKVMGKPFLAGEIENAILDLMFDQGVYGPLGN